MNLRCLRSSAGVTLTELMVAVTILTVGVLGLMGTFGFITKSIRGARSRTIATNLAQEKIESLKDLSYPNLLVTSFTYTNNNFNPALVYDNSNYPQETLTYWCLPPVTRAAYVAYAAPVGNSISTVPYTSNDTGLKQITVYVFWNQDGAWRKVSMTNLLENPSVLALDATITGNVSKSGGGNLPGALISVLGSPQWRATADASGNYSFKVAHGSYSVVASSFSYRSQTQPSAGYLSVAANSSVTQNFTLTAIASGTLSAYRVYTNPNLLVSQVVSSTNTTVFDSSNHDVEYVELFNPTAAPINIGTGGTRLILLNYVGEAAPDSISNIALVYNSTYVASGRYYLIANSTGAFGVSGSWMSPDASYDTSVYGSYKDIIKNNKAGAVQITDSSGNILDGVGWSHSGVGASAPWAEGGGVPQTGGIQSGDQIVRMSSPCVVNTGYGRAYDSHDNQNNFFYNTAAPGSNFPYPPYNTAAYRSNISGLSALAGFAAANDGLSSALALLTGNATNLSPSQTCPYAYFNIPSVATGTWTVTVSTGMYSQSVSNVSVTQGVTTIVLNATTSPPDPTGFLYLPISSPATGGYISGTVLDGFGNQISGIKVQGGGSSDYTTAAGLYFLNATTGTVTVTANPNNLNPNYINQSVQVTVSLGSLVSQNFTLTQGGGLTGYVTTGLSALPGVVVTASNGTGGTGTGASDGTGYYYINNLATGTYTVTPSLAGGQSSSPANFPSAALTNAGTTVFVGTFTITGAFSNIIGNVTYSGRPITTGVLVIASTATITDPPLTISLSTSAAGTPYYAVSSQPDGTYNLQVRGLTSGSYNMRAFYPVVNVNTGAATYKSKTLAGVSVSPGSTVSGQNFTDPWP